MKNESVDNVKFTEDTRRQDGIYRPTTCYFIGYAAEAENLVSVGVDGHSMSELDVFFRCRMV